MNIKVVQLVQQAIPQPQTDLAAKPVLRANVVDSATALRLRRMTGKVTRSPPPPSPCVLRLRAGQAPLQGPSICTSVVDSATALRLRGMTGKATPSLPTTVTLRPATARRTGSIAGSIDLHQRCGFCDCAALAQNDGGERHPRPTTVTLRPATAHRTGSVAGSIDLHQRCGFCDYAALAQNDGRERHPHSPPPSPCVLRLRAGQAPVQGPWICISARGLQAIALSVFNKNISHAVAALHSCAHLHPNSQP